MKLELKKKMLIGLMVATLVFGAIMIAPSFGGAESTDIGFGPAPNSVDGISDGSGFDQDNWSNQCTPAKGPAPNSGDGIPDGSGF